MRILELRLTDFRILRSQILSKTGKCNVIYGENGAGKTSILEAIYMLSSGRSFRNTSYKHLINRESQSMNVFIEAHNSDGMEQVFKIGLNRERTGKKRIKINGDVSDKQSKVSRLLPVLAIDSETYQFIDGSPQGKRSYLDWMVFHVKHSYLLLWSKLNTCHKHLNSIYKSKKLDTETVIWEEKFAYYSEKVTKHREETFSAMCIKMEKLITHFMGEKLSLSLRFDKGWKQSRTMLEQLNKDKNRNIEYGLVNSGPHKMNIHILEQGQPAVHILSRGQKKILSVLFFLCSAEVVYESTGIPPILCIDDISAELDKHYKNKLLLYLKESPYQLFLTSVEASDVNYGFDDVQLFHVKQP